uniref:Uncharacterized protein n=1 Tax=Anguilla anguilla TaxID=7936 RepID=A0A0E9WML1_ANGAN
MLLNCNNLTLRYVLMSGKRGGKNNTKVRPVKAEDCR